MTSTAEQRIRDVVFRALEDAAYKVRRSSKETNPFIDVALPRSENHAALVRSVSTRIGQSIMPEVVTIVAEDAGYEIERDVKLQVPVSGLQKKAVDEILKELRQRLHEPDFQKEVRRVREASAPYEALAREEGPEREDMMIDFVLEKEDHPYYVELKSPKLSQNGIMQVRRQALLLGADAPDAVFVLALYYGTREENLHRRSGLNYLDRYFETSPHGQSCSDIFHHGSDSLPSRIRVMRGREFWNWLGEGQNTYDVLLEAFREAGSDLRERYGDLFGNQTE